MAELSPFTYCGVDLFGPFVIRSKRKELKRYGFMFTCPCRRAIHIENTYSLDKSSFLMTLQSLVGRRGGIVLMRSDSISNFAEAVKELQKSFQDMNQSRRNEYWQMHGVDWITWIRNPPTESHIGVVWERQIRTVRGILNTLIKTHGKNLDNKSLHILHVKV